MILLIKGRPLGDERIKPDSFLSIRLFTCFSLFSLSMSLGRGLFAGLPGFANHQAFLQSRSWFPESLNLTVFFQSTSPLSPLFSLCPLAGEGGSMQPCQDLPAMRHSSIKELVVPKWNLLDVPTIQHPVTYK